MTERQNVLLRNRAYLFGVSLFAITFALPALAQLPASADRAATTSANPSRVDDQFDEENILPEVSAPVSVNRVAAQQAPDGAEEIFFTLDTLALEGVSAYNQSELEAIYQSKLGQRISLAELYGIAGSLTNKYRNDGYVLTQVVVPPQTIEDGNVSLRVVEGYIDTVRVEGQDDPNALGLIKRYAGQISTGQALNVRDLERQLLLINDLPGVEARSVISASPTKTGAADLRIIIERDPYDALLAIDNHGSRYLGPIQATAAGSLNSFFGNNETITAQLVVAPDFGDGIELGYFALSYEQPVWDHGTTLTFSASHTDTEPGYNLDDFDVEGRSQLFSVTAEHPFIRSRAQNFYGRITFDWRDLESSNNLEATREDNIRSIRAGARYELLDTLFGVGINSADVVVSQGLDVFGASDEGDANLTRAQGDPQYFKVEADVQRLQRITSNVNLLVGARGQWSNDALLSSEEFGVGGINLGRAYDPSEIVGDRGVAGKVEVQWNEPTEWRLVQDYQVYGFYDVGKVWNEDATANNQKVNSLASAGVGLRMDFMEQTAVGMAVAFPLSRDVETQQDDDPRVYFSLSRRF